MTPWRRLTGRLCLVALAVLAASGGATIAQGRATATFPGAEWERIADPKSAGYCQAGLDAATARAQTLPTTGVMVVVGGRVLWQHGDLQAVTYVASVRKSILAMLFGRYVQRGTIALERTLAALEIDDNLGLAPGEKEATVLDLLSARSGVYHPAANAASSAGGDTVGTPPARGSVKHGTYFLYNNWDFNALGTIFEQETGRNIYDAFEQDLARPIGLQDFNRAAQRKSAGPAGRSRHPAYHFDLSTRDLARVGYVMLRDGAWAGRELVPASWVRKMVTPVTRVADMNPDAFKKGPFGYGLLWWVWDGPSATGAYKGAYAGIGAIGQYLVVLPALDMVVAHKTRPGRTEVSRPQFLDLLDTIIAARCAPVAHPPETLP